MARPDSYRRCTRRIRTNSFEMGFFFHGLWSAPMVIIAALIGLYIFIGWAGVLSVAILILFFPLQGYLAKTMMTLRFECAKVADRRLQAINEYLQGIRIVKFMCWEREAEKAVNDIRQEELSRFHPLFVLRSMFICINTVLPMVVTFAVFAIAYKWGKDINPKSIFPTMAMLNVLRMPLIMLPLSIGKLVDLSVSLNRIQQFLLFARTRAVPHGDHGPELTRRRRDAQRHAAVPLRRGPIGAQNDHDGRECDDPEGETDAGCGSDGVREVDADDRDGGRGCR